MSYEYKCIGAPEKLKRVRGAKTRSDRLAVAMEEIINDEAINGWEYVRADLVPVEERSSFLSRAQEVHRAVLVFRRPTVIAQRGAMQPMQHPMYDPAPQYPPVHYPPQQHAPMPPVAQPASMAAPVAPPPAAPQPAPMAAPTDQTLRLGAEMEAQQRGPRPTPGRRPPRGYD